MSIVVNPSLWYGRLVNYKNGSDEDHTLVSALTAAYLSAHESRIAGLLGGDISSIVVVPSTRGREFSVHPLALAVKRSRVFGHRLIDGLQHVPGTTIQRQEYKPSIFHASPSTRHQRIVLIEDLWVSGARPVSAAGALLEAGAQAVVIIPIAREIRPSTPSFCPEEYVQQVQRTYDITNWPR